MAANDEVKMESLPDLDELLQCPVCYEIPTAQIFQCNEGHHVCGRCKARIDVCPVCRSFFFGTRNYAMEELIASIKKLKSFKLVGKVTTGPDITSSSQEEESSVTENEVANSEASSSSARSTIGPPPASKGLFRCLCCKGGRAERLPSARMLNHLRYFHSNVLIEGKSEEGHYNQTWQFTPGGSDRIVTAIRVSDMGIFFFVIEFKTGSLYAWVSMAEEITVAREFSYTVSILGNDREALFSDNVFSVKTCEGAMKKRGQCLSVSGANGLAITNAISVRAKVSLRRAPSDLLGQRLPPRGIVRVASRVRESPSPWVVDSPPPEYEQSPPDHDEWPLDLEPFLLELQDDVTRLSRAFAHLGHGDVAQSLMHTGTFAPPQAPTPLERRPIPPPASTLPAPLAPAPTQNISRHARRRMRARLRAALNATEAPSSVEAPTSPEVDNMRHVSFVSPEPTDGPSTASPHQQNGQVRANKKKRRRHR